MSKYMILSGFLGAGKTTLMIAFAEYLAQQGTRAAILVNDLGRQDLVDSAFTAEADCCSSEITGGCICYQTGALVEQLRRFRDSSGAEIIFSDIPGCGVGALEHVYHKLNREYGGEFRICPFTAVADPERLRVLMPEHAELHLPQEMNYLFDAQLREAEVILLNKVDLLSPQARADCLDFLAAAYPDAKVFAVSAKTGEGIPAAIAYLCGRETSFPEVDIGYGGPDFIAAERCLSWYNRKCRLTADGEIDGNAFLSRLFDTVRIRLLSVGGNVPHLKAMARGTDGSYAKASLIGVDYVAQFDARFLRPQGSLQLILNARAACEAGVMDFLMDAALRETAAAFGASVQVFFTECFGMTEKRD